MPKCSANSKNKQICSLYFLKAICAFMVIMLHTPFDKILKEITTPICQIAVPVFFIISGYFFYNKRELSYEVKLRNIIKKNYWLNNNL